MIDAPADDSLFLPSKLVDYLPLGKPILGLTPLARRDGRRSFAGSATPIVPPDDEAAIAARDRGADRR